MKFRYQYLIASGITSIGAFIIYARQHTRFTFDIGEFLSWLPVVWGFVLVMGLCFGIFLGEKKIKDGNN